MKWINAQLYTKTETSKDKLKNPIYTSVKKADIKLRITPQKTEIKSTLGQQYTTTNLKLITPEKSEIFMPLYLHSLVIDNIMYSIESVTANSRFTYIVIKEMKQ